VVFKHTVSDINLFPSGLRDLETSFTCIILPEGIKKNLQGEPSVLEEYIHLDIILN